MNTAVSEVVAEEFFSGSEIKKYIKFENIGIKSDTLFVKNINTTRWSGFMSVFLPQGYPHSVSEDYIQYQIWDSIQAFSSSILGSLSTRAVLQGVGVGDAAATPMAATITWLLKDGTGMLGRILFAWMQGIRLDSECKKWRLFADILNDVTLFIDLISPYFKDYFTLVICISGLGKSIVGVAGGATRAALTQHQARNNNMADVSAKDGSQETLLNLSALICSLIFIPFLSNNFESVWISYIILTTIHLFANYCAVRSVVMETFNMSRYRILLKDYLLSNKNQQFLLSFKEVNMQEDVLLSIIPEHVKINLGVSLNNIFTGYEELLIMKNIYREAGYMLNISIKGERIVIDIVLHSDSTPITQLEAMFQAFVLQWCFKEPNVQLQVTNDLRYDLQVVKDSVRSVLNIKKYIKMIPGDKESFLDTSRQFTLRYFPAFLEKIELAGWVSSHVLFGTDEWRARW